VQQNNGIMPPMLIRINVSLMSQQTYIGEPYVEKSFTAKAVTAWIAN